MIFFLNTSTNKGEKLPKFLKQYGSTPRPARRSVARRIPGKSGTPAMYCHTQWADERAVGKEFIIKNDRIGFLDDLSLHVFSYNYL